MSDKNDIEEVYLEDDELEEIEEVYLEEGIVKRSFGKLVGFVKRHPIVTSAIAGTVGVIAGKKIASKKKTSNDITNIYLTEDGAAELTSDDDPDDSNDNVD